MTLHEYRTIADVETAFESLPHVKCHVGEINQVVVNLIINAAHAIGDVVRGTMARGTITVRTRTIDNEVELSITDTGGGIPDTIRDRIFDPFFTTKAVGPLRASGVHAAVGRANAIECNRIHPGRAAAARPSGMQCSEWWTWRSERPAPASERRAAHSPYASTIRVLIRDCNRSFGSVIVATCGACPPDCAGFKLLADADFLRNPGGPCDWNANPGADPQTHTQDRFVRKFVKP